jgi:hypothetical protein
LLDPTFTAKAGVVHSAGPAGVVPGVLDEVPAPEDGVTVTVTVGLGEPPLDEAPQADATAATGPSTAMASSLRAPDTEIVIKQ